MLSEYEATLALNLTAGIGHARAALLEKAFGSVPAIFEQDADTLSQVRGISGELAQKLLENAGKPLETELGLIERGNVRVLTRSDEEYPETLREIEDPPLCLYVCGALPEELGKCSVAIVGSRRATAYGMRVARNLAESAVLAGWTVVSGLAAGIDTVAHKGTVGVCGKTVAVLGGGLMRIQPQENVVLAREILTQGGAIVTEQPMTFPPTRHTFPMRNRIISALSTATVVVEAGSHSGALITATAAVGQGRPVFAVPGPLDSEMSVGCHDLIKSGAAQLLTSFEDILSASDFLPGIGSDRQDSLLSRESDSAEQQFHAQSDDALSDTDRSIQDFLRKNGDSGIDEISAGTGIAALTLSRKIVALELAKKIMRTDQGTYRRTR